MDGNSDLFVRLPYPLLDDLGDGDVTASMLAVMCILLRLADWKTGKVKYITASGLETLSGGSVKKRTAQYALDRLEAQGYITCHTVRGSTKPYPVTIHNYTAWRNVPRRGEDGKLLREDGRVVTEQRMCMLNPSTVYDCRGSEKRHCADDAADDATGVAVALPGGCQEVALALPHIKHNQSLQSGPEPQAIEEGEQRISNISGAAALPPPSLTIEQEDWRQEEPVDSPVDNPVDGGPVYDPDDLSVDDAQASAWFWETIGIPEPAGSAREFRRLRESLGEWEGSSKFGLCLGWLAKQGTDKQRERLRNAAHPLAYLRSAVEDGTEVGWLKDIVDRETWKADRKEGRA
jgi:hypothetical protein